MFPQSELRESHMRPDHKQSLPRGYFKKRKDERPKNANEHCSDYCSVSFLSIVIVLIAFVTSEVSCEQIVPDFKLDVKGLDKPAPSLITGNLGENRNSVCSSIIIRFDPELERLKGCRVVEGSISILMLDELSEEFFKNYTFPELVEITGFLMLYRISGTKSLYDLFPNLAVIRGRELFHNFALILYELLDLEEIGLTSLQTIERGSVRIEKNDRLCFADRVDWNLIAESGDQNFIEVRHSEFHVVQKIYHEFSFIEKSSFRSLSSLQCR